MVVVETSSSDITGVAVVKPGVERRAEERRLATPTRAELGLALYKSVPEYSSVFCDAYELSPRYPGITGLLSVPTRAVVVLAFCEPRAVTLAREGVEEVLFTTFVVRAVREAVPRAVPVAERGELAIAREVVLVRDAPELVVEDIARDADVERLIVLR